MPVDNVTGKTVMGLRSQHLQVPLSGALEMIQSWEAQQRFPLPPVHTAAGTHTGSVLTSYGAVTQLSPGVFQEQMKYRDQDEPNWPTGAFSL